MARRHSIAQRTRVASDDGDFVLEGAIALSGWAQRNRPLLTSALIAAALAFGGGLYYLNYQKTHRERAAVELERVQQAALVGDTATAKVELGRYIESFGNTPYADEARLLLAQMYLQSNQTDQAVQVLQPASDPGKPLGRQAAALLARALEQQGKPDDAEQLLLRIAEKSELDFEKRDAYEQAARIRQRRGDPAGAAELYQKILDGMKETEPGRPVYEMRLEEMKAQQKKG